MQTDNGQNIVTKAIDAGPYAVYMAPLAAAGRPSGRRQAERQAVAGLVSGVFGPQARLEHQPDGAPVVAGCGEHPSISVSHGAGMALLAVAKLPGMRIGVDVESERPQLRRVAARFVSATDDSEHLTFLELWTAKEAAFKAIASLAGGGVTLIDINVTARPGGADATIGGIKASVSYHRMPEGIVAVATAQG